MLDFDNFGHRFALVLKSLKVTKHGIATKLDVSHTTISNIINHTNSQSIDKLVKILAMSPNLNLDWLITGRGKMYLNETRCVKKNYGVYKVVYEHAEKAAWALMQLSPSHVEFKTD